MHNRLVKRERSSERPHNHGVDTSLRGRQRAGKIGSGSGLGTLTAARGMNYCR
jgi:hypothetical protein